MRHVSLSGVNCIAWQSPVSLCKFYQWNFEWNHFSKYLLEILLPTAECPRKIFKGQFRSYIGYQQKAFSAAFLFFKQNGSFVFFHEFTQFKIRILEQFFQTEIE